MTEEQRLALYPPEVVQQFIDHGLPSPIKYDPYERVWGPMPGSQQAFLQCPFFEVLYEGTRGPGKTDTLLMDFAMDTGTGLGTSWRGILFRQTYKQLQDVISKTTKWFPLIFPRARFNASDHVWTWPDGEKLFLRQFTREQDYWNYHGHEYPWVAWEELCNWADPVGYLRMMSTCRSSNPKVAKLLRYRSTTNPYGPGHNWVKHRFRLPGWRSLPIREDDENGRALPARVAVHGNINENLILLKSDPEYIQRLISAARNDAELQAWVYGSWDIVAGGMFDDVWNPKVHVVRSFNIPPSWRIDRSFDWGSSRPFSVGWWAQSDGSDYLDGEGRLRSSVRGDLFRIAEWYGSTGEPNVGLKMLATDIAKGIIQREIDWGIHGRVRPGPADSSIFDVENGMCIADDMERRVRLDDGREFPGPRFERADKSPGSRKTGWEQMRKMFQAAKPPQVGVRERPGLFIFGRCRDFQRTVPVLPRDEKDMDDVDSDAEDHIADETRYRVRQVTLSNAGGKVVGMW